MIVVGMVSYRYAEDGLSQKYMESTQQTANMATDYMDVSCSGVKSVRCSMLMMQIWRSIFGAARSICNG